MSTAHDAVFALYEPLGAVVLRAAAEQGIAVPADLLVAAARDTGIGRTTLPTLTVLEFQADRLGAEAVGLLIDRLETPAMEATTRIVAQPAHRRRVHRPGADLALTRSPDAGYGLHLQFRPVGYESS